MVFLLLFLVLFGGPVWAQNHAFSQPEATVRHVYKWVCKPAQDKDLKKGQEKLKGMFFAVCEPADLRAHEGDFTDEFAKAMRSGFRAGTFDFDFLSCMFKQVPVRAPVVGVAQVRGDAATVPVDLTVDYRNVTKEQQIIVELRRVGGLWRVSNVKNAEGFDVLKNLSK